MIPNTVLEFSKWSRVTENYIVWCHLGDLASEPVQFDNIRNTILLLDLIFLGLA